MVGFDSLARALPHRQLSHCLRHTWHASPEHGTLTWTPQLVWINSVDLFYRQMLVALMILVRRETSQASNMNA